MWLVLSSRSGTQRERFTQTKIRSLSDPFSPFWLNRSFVAWNAAFPTYLPNGGCLDVGGVSPPTPLKGCPRLASSGNKLRSCGSQLLQNENNWSCHWAEGRERIGERRESSSSFIHGGDAGTAKYHYENSSFSYDIKLSSWQVPDAVSVCSENTRGTEFFNLSSFLIILFC